MSSWTGWVPWELHCKAKTASSGSRLACSMSLTTGTAFGPMTSGTNAPNDGPRSTGVRAHSAIASLPVTTRTYAGQLNLARISHAQYLAGEHRRGSPTACAASTPTRRPDRQPRTRASRRRSRPCVDDVVPLLRATAGHDGCGRRRRSPIVPSTVGGRLSTQASYDARRTCERF